MTHLILSNRLNLFPKDHFPAWKKKSCVWKSAVICGAHFFLLTTYGVSAATSEVEQAISANSERFLNASRQIWGWAELGYKETKSSQLLADELRKSGFTVKMGVAEIPTAFVAEFGQGHPVIGLLAEYDALPRSSQKAEPEKGVNGKNWNGHACGHNLLGAGSALAAVALKDWLKASGTQGTIRLYGCPAEEGGGGKNYMVRAGLFTDCDVVLAWHPADSSSASLESSMANISAKVRYHGIAAHASRSPESGRSALDAVMIATHAIDLLREHVPDSTRLHYIITQGGSAPNIVPDFSEIYLYVRSPDAGILGEIWERVRACAEAGALATGTTVEIEVINSNSNKLPNDALASLVDKHLRALGGISYSPDEKDFAEKIRATLPDTDLPPISSAGGILPIKEGHTKGSSDVGDVSWSVPTTEFTVATWVPGTPLHSWQATACSGMSIGEKGLILAAKTMTLSAQEIYLNPTLVQDAAASFEKRLANKKFQSHLPKDAKPPLNYRN